MSTKNMVKKPYRKTIHALRYVEAGDLFTPDVKGELTTHFLVDDGSSRWLVKEDALAYLQVLSDESFRYLNEKQMLKELTWAIAEVKEIPEGVLISLY